MDAAANGYTNVLWGSDYPHLEGTCGHTQETLHSLFDEGYPALRQRIMVEAFRELFPHVPAIEWRRSVLMWGGDCFRIGIRRGNRTIMGDFGADRPKGR